MSTSLAWPLALDWTNAYMPRCKRHCMPEQQLEADTSPPHEVGSRVGRLWAGGRCRGVAQVELRADAGVGAGAVAARQHLALRDVLQAESTKTSRETQVAASGPGPSPRGNTSHCCRRDVTRKRRQRALRFVGWLCRVTKPVKVLQLDGKSRAQHRLWQGASR